MDETKLTVSTPAGVVGLAGRLVGFEPVESLVAILLQRGCVAVTARIDLMHLISEDAVGAVLGPIWQQISPDQVFLVGFSDVPLLGWDAAHRVAEWAESMGTEAVCLVTSQGLLMSDPADPGVPLGAEAAQIDSEAESAGMSKVASREALAATVASEVTDPDALLTATIRARRRLRRLPSAERSRTLDDLIDRFDAGAPLGVDDVAAAAKLAETPEVALHAIRTLDRDTAAGRAQFWAAVARGCASPARFDALALAGVAGWLSGAGALASVCMEAIEREGGSTQVAALLDMILRDAVPPSRWSDVQSVLGVRG